MKTLRLLLFVAVALAAGCGTKTNTGSFSYTITQSTTYTNLPPLQSFVFAKSGSYWLMFGGRTNGFHGFGTQQDFPFKKSNKWIYVFNTDSNRLDSMNVKFLPDTLEDQFISSNVQHVQVGNYLYACGGYGETSTADSNWSTYSTISRINVSAMINTVLTHDSLNLGNTVVYDMHPIVQATGGELFRLADSTFYLAVGHRFTGAYSSSTFTQVYLDSVHIFKLIETPTSIQVDPTSFKYLSDNLTDTITQFRRRDLVIVPAIEQDNVSVGLTIYGGVFTGGVNGGNPWYNPIYIKGGSTPSYVLDTTYTQPSNLYSAANLTMYDLVNGRMYTSIFGGIVDTATINGDNAVFTPLILSIDRDVRGGGPTTSVFNPTAMPGYLGAESVFIPAANVPMYSPNYRIIDYNVIPKNQPVLLGYIYGGILSDTIEWGQGSNPTSASNVVYEVRITKN